MNIAADPDKTLSGLKALLGRFRTDTVHAGGASIRLGSSHFDEALDDGLPRAALHEILAEDGTRDAAAASGFGLGLALRAAKCRPLVWIQQVVADREAGCPFGAGMADFGADPEGILLVRAPDQPQAMQAAEDALRCPPVGAVLVELWGEGRASGLTATRRLSFAAGRSGNPCILVRLGASPAPSAATTRWSVAAAPSRPLEANAPGRPAFTLTLLRHRAGIPGRTWPVEWDRDRLAFADPAPVSRPVVPVPVRREVRPFLPRRRLG